MDCWYWVLNCIPRYELRQGGFESEAEQVAPTQYSAILREARAVIAAAAVMICDKNVKFEGGPLEIKSFEIKSESTSFNLVYVLVYVYATYN